MDFTRLDGRQRFFMAGFLAIVAFVAMQSRVSFATQLVGTWDVFTFVTVVLAWIVMTTKDPYEVRRNAGKQDASATFLFGVIVSAATVSLFAVFILLGSSKGLSKESFVAHFGLSLAAIGLSWTLIHTLFSIRYAHFYYADAHKVERNDIQGGLIFPGDESPDYLDFAYFSFVIGMTCQVSDVQISSKGMRRLAVLHGLISFTFNTAILAIFVNIIAGLL